MSSRINETPEFEKKREQYSARALASKLLSNRYLFDSVARDFTHRYKYLSSEPELVDEITINGEPWEIWQGVFSSGGCFSDISYDLVLRRIPKSKKEELSLFHNRTHHYGNISLTYLEWKKYLESRGDNIVSVLTRYINAREHQGLLSKYESSTKE